MEKLVIVLILGLFSVTTVRLLLLPLRLLGKTAIHSAAGLICLWLLNAIAPFTGIVFPVNAVTVLVSGFLGLPGLGVLAWLTVM